MKLREFNTDNTISMRTVQPTVHINTRTGLFTFNKPACSLIGLSGDNQIVFHQDEEDPECWYVEVVKEKGFGARGKDKSKGLMFNNTTIARSIFDSVSFTGKSGRVLVAVDPVPIGKKRLFPLITAFLKVKSED